ncbi:hypothetical protein COEREDRAFT_79119 [Coemansia reversa NRRL 1564]|uniref:C2H2-type domain-containing protein n=1 Tax=Coemansia reversa (strain ATCC 12441 / NRRL 1564) TaxID=763665 RepID=A0A2G5BJJ1_COERN|nr:hypothetical protein COEREDRAFT_79119 [Coemansia reversa NRRL 1564]|eukprot:PIA19142.1 hypothetical protein COEREDRAFT_79119 [Coemansia reversa NRRL 1564]
MACSPISRSSAPSSGKFRCNVLCRYCYQNFFNMGLLQDHFEVCSKRPIPREEN